MYKIKLQTKFKKDISKIKKQGKKTEKLKKIIDELSAGNKLPRIYLDHYLKGKHIGLRECHIEPDWLLIYFIENDFLNLVRTGSHSDLFN